jgi:hypothetical protein
MEGTIRRWKRRWKLLCCDIRCGFERERASFLRLAKSMRILRILSYLILSSLCWLVT